MPNSIVRRLSAAALVVAAGRRALPASASPDASLKDTMKKMRAQALNGDPKPLSTMFDR